MHRLGEGEGAGRGDRALIRMPLVRPPDSGQVGVRLRGDISKSQIPIYADSSMIAKK